MLSITIHLFGQYHQLLFNKQLNSKLDTGITIAIIAASASIFSTTSGILLKQYFDQKKENDKYASLEDHIKDAVTGKWKGYFDQTLDENHFKYQVTLDLKVSSKGSLIGKAKVPFEDEIFDINVKGGFYTGRFLKMDYENSDKAIQQFGAFVLNLSSNNKKLTGFFVGFGHITERIMGGIAVLEKV